MSISNWLNTVEAFSFFDYGKHSCWKQQHSIFYRKLWKSQSDNQHLLVLNLKGQFSIFLRL